MTTKSVDLKDLQRVVRQDMKARERRVREAVRKTTVRGVKVVRGNVPVAFAELLDSVHVQGTKIITDAPHAGAVENGSRPHWVPIEALLAWVRLRGMQGLQSDKQLKRSRGTTTATAARHIASAIRNHMLTDGSDAIAADAPMQIARAIQASIAKRGTKPHAFAKTSLPAIESILDREVRAALPEKV